jgi:hypothetical protein
MYVDEAGEESGPLRNGVAGFEINKPVEPSEPQAEGEKGTPA